VGARRWARTLDGTIVRYADANEAELGDVVLIDGKHRGVVVCHDTASSERSSDNGLLGRHTGRHRIRGVVHYQKR
jgi:hypothetical protein